MNNKKYFTKYLPVGGEIKDGDWRMHPFTMNVVRHSHEDGDEYINKHTEWEKTKLFLCSRDIQVGDEILVDGFPHIKPTKVVNIEITNPDHSVHIPIYNCENGDWYEIHEIFKVIGEISPDALSYVKEGQEFEDYQLAERWFRDENDNPIAKIFVEIKGPCGHFH